MEGVDGRKCRKEVEEKVKEKSEGR